MEQNKVTWTELKSISSSTGIAFRYMDMDSLYHVWIDYGAIHSYCDIQKDSGTDHTDFENNYKPCLDKRIMFQCGKTPDNVPLVTTIKNFAWNSITRCSHDFSDKRTWHQNATACTGKSCSHVSGYTNYSIPSDLITMALCSDRDILSSSTYDITVKKNGTTVTNWSINPRSKEIVFDTANLSTDTITADGYEAQGSKYTLTPTSGKFFMIDYIEVQLSSGCVMNDTIYFDAVLNNAATGNTDYTAGRTSYNTAKDFLNKSNHGNSFPAFGELSSDVIILPWNFTTGYKVFPVGTKCDPTKGEFNKLTASLANDDIVTSCEIACVTFYGYELDL